jgi:hypothetical protein
VNRLKADGQLKEFEEGKYKCWRLLDDESESENESDGVS